MTICDEAVFRNTQVLPYRGPFNPYRGTDQDVEELLLFTHRREVLWKNFLQWRTEMKQLFGQTVFWVNGSFVTVKADPEDIDVIALVSTTSYRQAVIKENEKIMSLETAIYKKPDGSKTRIQPYGGLVDARIIPCDNITRNDENLKYWDSWWSHVNIKKGYIHTSVSQKGFLEVK